MSGIIFLGMHLTLLSCHVQHQHVHEAASTGFAGISSLSAQAMHERQEVRAFVTVTATEGRLQFET